MKNNRCAFPRSPVVITREENGAEVVELHHGHEGMSLREWYAGQALPVLMRVSFRDLRRAQRHRGFEIPTEEHFIESIVEAAFKYADAMISESEKGR